MKEAVAGILAVAKQLVAKTPYDYMSESEKKRAYDEMGKHLPQMKTAAQAFIRAVRKLYPKVNLKMNEGFSTNFVQVWPYVEVDVAPQNGRPMFEIRAEYDTRRIYDYGNEVAMASFISYTIGLRLRGVATPSRYGSKTISGVMKDAMDWLNHQSENNQTDLMITLGLDPNLRPGAGKPKIEEVKAFIQKESWFDVEQEGFNRLTCSTRDNGSIGDEEPGPEDVRMAKNVGKLLLDKYGSNNLNVKLELVDEWVHLTVTIK